MKQSRVLNPEICNLFGTHFWDRGLGSSGTGLNAKPAVSGVTSFPADPTIVKVEYGPDVVTAVDPGVGLELAIDESQLGTAAGKIDPSTVRIMTRENPGDPWVALPSYYDKATGKVRGESDQSCLQLTSTSTSSSM